MSETSARPVNGLPAPNRFLPLLLLLFVGSGCAALIYEIVWLQLLQLVIGSSAVSLGVLLGTFMGGMCLGSLALPRSISARRHPLRVYAALELLIGVCGLVLLFLVPGVARIYVASAGHGMPAVLLRGGVCAVCLLLPTLLMGATLPAVARWLETTPSGVSWLGFFYGSNLAGAVFGCLLAGFYLLRVHDMAFATYVAAGINVAVALIGLGLAALTPHTSFADDPKTARVEAGPAPVAVYFTIALSGMTALGAEVVWTRLLSLMLGATVYTFSIILAVFLVGLGIGSSVGAFLGRAALRPRMALGGCQLLLVAGIAWSAYMLGKSVPFWPIDPSLTNNPWVGFQLDIARCAWAILPPACFWGASFPLALAAVAARGKDPGRLVGGVYAANTVGAIIGAVGCSLFLIAWIGTQQAQRVLIGISAVAALIMFVTCLRPTKADNSGATTSTPSSNSLAGLLAILATVVLAGLFIWSVPKLPWTLVAHGRYLATRGEDRKLLYVGEGMNASVAVTQNSDGVRNFHVSGKIEASTDERDMRLQRMLGHLPALIHPNPRSVLIVGCGAGVTAGSFIEYPGIDKIVICEIEPLIPHVVAKYFAAENYGVVTNGRVRIVHDDARNFVLTTREKFDIITSDPIHPWVKGAATLYTKEYFEMCRAHLNPGGLVTQWVPLYESNPAVVKSEVATFFNVFTNGTIWGNDDGGKGYDVVLLGQAGPTRIDVDELQRRLELPAYAQVAQSLLNVGFHSAVELLGTYSGQAADLGEWLDHAEINRDRNLRLQFLAGMSPSLYQEEAIFADMSQSRKYPANIFAASPETKAELRLWIDRTPPSK